MTRVLFVSTIFDVRFLFYDKRFFTNCVVSGREYRLVPTACLVARRKMSEMKYLSYVFFASFFFLEYNGRCFQNSMRSKIKFNNIH